MESTSMSNRAPVAVTVCVRRATWPSTPSRIKATVAMTTSTGTRYAARREPVHHLRDDAPDQHGPGEGDQVRRTQPDDVRTDGARQENTQANDVRGTGQHSDRTNSGDRGQRPEQHHLADEGSRQLTAHLAVDLVGHDLWNGDHGRLTRRA